MLDCMWLWLYTMDVQVHGLTFICQRWKHILMYMKTTTSRDLGINHFYRTVVSSTKMRLAIGPARPLNGEIMVLSFMIFYSHRYQLGRLLSS
ncbi:hypothetical protein MDV096.5 [Gallid alphaherpesvirus 2]|uniref:Uncharacterized protein n=1 Tax=Gallid alphaherpesvirus 2 TaxID=10390 RepID=Q19B18_9ALPH|nr:hypothetical protein MDV096.5 [Gallid alphaherpesvirus 2]ACF49598.1 hypothetical protein MDV096.5 [synthetic construct]ABR13216.1 hypothetical protein MDV096.5 [Gallid alphaherpesvirus 2]ACF94888.1 hypothetical protein MDV096.5 [Gallid alphaherpesvirus 2]AEZ51791.1 hypothetical protein MDV096.5 [Gallid alphaherpesvirus 2]